MPSEISISDMTFSKVSDIIAMRRLSMISDRIMVVAMNRAY
jgi:hypothetical protein